MASFEYVLDLGEQEEVGRSEGL